MSKSIDQGSKKSQASGIIEIFTSIQGEGLYCGQRQTFIRFAGCNLACGYCDTVRSQSSNPDACKIETISGSGCFSEIPNPVDVETVVAACERLGAKNISITGGEPLLQINYLAELTSRLSEKDFIIHLETNGTLHRELSQVINVIDVIAMDIKLPSSSGQECWDDHAQFLSAASKGNVFVKAVVSADTPIGEISRCAQIISNVDCKIPLIIQPVSGGENIPGQLMMKLQEAALALIEDVRVIPQCHKFLGML